MPPSANNFDVSGAPGSSEAAKAQPVALEVPVTVHGARTVEGSDKREPFAESTQTVLVFGNGAVIRLASSVAPGQLLFLTNEKTKKEVVCQVVKSKNYRNVSGYVELEFTEAVSGFWGVRFPAAQPNAPAATQQPVAAKPPVAPVVAPRVEAASSLPKPPQPQPQHVLQAPAHSVAPPPPPAPVRTETLTASALKVEVKPGLNLPRAGDPHQTATLPPLSSSSFSTSATTSTRAPEIKPPAPVAPIAHVATKAPQAPPTPGNIQSDALARESARLQQELSSMLFTPEVPAKSALPPESIAKVIEMAKPQAAKPAAPAKSASPLGSSLDADEVKIPSWLEPLARNAATPSHNEIPTAAKDDSDEVLVFEVQDLSVPATTQETAAAASVVAASAPADALPPTHLPSETAASTAPHGQSNKGILIGAIAAGLLIAVAGGTWYARQGSTPVQPAATATTAAAPATTVASNLPAPVAQPSTTRSAESPATSRANARNSEPENLPPVSSAANSQPTTPTAQPLKNSLQRDAEAELSAYRKLAEPSASRVAAQPASKKPSLGEVHLATPALKGRDGTSDVAAPSDLGPALNGGQVATSDSLSSGLAGNTRQPTAPPAPLPVGGDVKQARLVSSTQPVYPTIAKNQHIQGDVTIDALIDATGKVSSMKVLSGPFLLHQAAMDALRQWKYQAATLDGKPVAMHLTVTLQFRLQ